MTDLTTTNLKRLLDESAPAPPQTSLRKSYGCVGS